MNVLTYWNESEREVPEVKTAAELERHLQVAALELTRLLNSTRVPGARSKYRHEQWCVIGVDPVQAHISSDGAAYKRDDRLRVIVKADQHLLRQRYTIAHEIGHCLLRQLLERNESLQLPANTEETLCDSFASQVLVPEPSLKGLMSKLKSAPTSKEILGWCREFDANIEPMLIAVKRHWRWGTNAILYCQHYAHHRNAEPALRLVSYAAEEHLYLPRHKRVQSLGLASIDEWFAGTQSHYGSGCEDKVKLPLYARDMDTRSGFVQGPAQWSAMRMNDSSHGAGRVFIDLQLVGEWSIRWAGGNVQPLDPTRLARTPERRKTNGKTAKGAAQERSAS